MRQAEKHSARTVDPELAPDKAAVKTTKLIIEAAAVMPTLANVSTNGERRCLIDSTVDRNNDENRTDIKDQNSKQNGFNRFDHGFLRIGNLTGRDSQ